MFHPCNPNKELRILRTTRISRASITLCQSPSANLKADQGMCFTGRLFRRKVVIGPYISSADVRNKPIGCEIQFENLKQI
jgi:hypothetical protein